MHLSHIVRKPALGLVPVLALSVAGLLPATAAPTVTTLPVGGIARVTAGPNNTQPNGNSADPSITDDGRYVAYTSTATNLVTGDTNGKQDVFVRDLGLGTTTRVSVGPNGAQANGDSFSPKIAAGGRYVVFSSSATNLVAGDTNGVNDIFVRDLQAGTTSRVSITPQGGQTDSHSNNPSISADGSIVAFESWSKNMTLGGVADNFYRDRVHGVTARIPRPDDAQPATAAGPGASADGALVSANGWRIASRAWSNSAANQQYLYRRSLNALLPTAIGSSDRHPISAFGISRDGRFLALLQDDGTALQVHDSANGTTTVEHPTFNGSALPGLAWSTVPGGLSGNGTKILFSTIWSPTNDGQNARDDVFLYDRATHTTTRVGLTSSGAAPNGASQAGALSSTANYVVFTSDATDVVKGDTNGKTDIFVRRIAT